MHEFNFCSHEEFEKRNSRPSFLNSHADSRMGFKDERKKNIIKVSRKSLRTQGNHFNYVFPLTDARLLFLFLLFLVYPAGISALHMTALQIPQHVALNETVRMVCNFNLDQETLYSVKWYKDGHEFYRYEPNEMPDVQVYSLEGVSVDTQDSTERSVVLKNVNKFSSGRYRCEVSAEAPAFRTVSDHADMTVVVLPNEGPQITGKRSKYLIGEIVRMNCTSAPSKPAALLTWFINGEPADLHYLKSPNIIVVDKNGLEIARLELEFRVQRNHFKRGDLKLKCLATIATMYMKSKEEHIQGDERTAVMESRETRAQSHTRSEDNGSESWTAPGRATILLILSVFTSVFYIR